MSFLSLTEMIKDGQKALSDKNYWCALSMALMLPSMCSRLAFDQNEKYYTEKNGYRHWRDKLAYCDWSREHLFRPGYLRAVLGLEGPEILYMLRCDMVHAGCADVYYNGRRIYLSINDFGATEFTDRLILDVRALCEQIFVLVEEWCRKFGADSFHYTFVFDTNCPDDRLLYQRLCDEARLERVQQEFDEYEQSRINN